MLRSIPITGVMPLPAVRNRILAAVGAEGEFPAAWSSWTTVPTVARRTRWLLTMPSGMAFTVIVMQPSARYGLRGQRVGPPLADTVDVDTDADVLAGHVATPAAARLDHQGDGVAGLGVDRDDAAAQGGAGAQGVDDVEVVGGNQRGGDPLGELHDPPPQCADVVGRGAVVVMTPLWLSYWV